MHILSHRGYWKSAEEKNSAKAFERSFALGFGIETDIRDYKGSLVISHDIAQEDAFAVEDLFRMYRSFVNNVPLALNVKADGLQGLLRGLLQRYTVENYFLFDMSAPESIIYVKEKMRILSRQSEYEKNPILYDAAAGIWLDGFEEDAWINEKIIRGHLNAGKTVCIVSPELHKRGHKPFWERLRTMNIIKENNLMLCTDYPEEARSILL